MLSGKDKQKVGYVAVQKITLYPLQQAMLVHTVVQKKHFGIRMWKCLLCSSLAKVWSYQTKSAAYFYHFI